MLEMEALQGQGASETQTCAEGITVAKLLILVVNLSRGYVMSLCLV